MSNLLTERLIARILALGAAFTAVFVITGSVTDPVNVPKLMSIGVVGSAVIGLVFSFQLAPVWRKNRSLICLLGLFLLFMTHSVVVSSSPLSQNIYGSYGRNNGFITYLFLIFILVGALSLQRRSSFELLEKGLLVAGLVNVIYCLWVVTFGDFIGWSNPYGNILGTFGNPNFIGSFLGLFFAAYLAYAMKPGASSILKYSSVLVLPITAFEIYKSHAIQGRVVAALGLGIIGFLYIRAKYGRIALLLYSTTLLSGGFLALLGALQIGPLTDYIYKTSVSLRGQYWLAGWNTGQSHPFSGVGMDAFGDWYRRSRDAHALEVPGVNTTVNAAHNVPLDMLAFGGWPLFLTYLTIMSFTGVAVGKLIRRRKEFDATLAVLVVAWAGYQLQSIISINQIGLAVWGWVLSGALIAYEQATRDGALQDAPRVVPQKKKQQELSFHPKLILVSTIGALIGLLIAIPPLTSDVKWRSAQLSRTVQSLESTMKPSYFTPQNSTMYLNNLQSLEGSNLFDLSHKYALEAVKWNPESFELWKVLYLIQKSTPAEKALALENMKRLDPLNPDVTSNK